MKAWFQVRISKTKWDIHLVLFSWNTSLIYSCMWKGSVGKVVIRIWKRKIRFLFIKSKPEEEWKGNHDIDSTPSHPNISDDLLNVLYSCSIRIGSTQFLSIRCFQQFCEVWKEKTISMAPPTERRSYSKAPPKMSINSKLKCRAADKRHHKLKVLCLYMLNMMLKIYLCDLNVRALLFFLCCFPRCRR